MSDDGMRVGLYAAADNPRQLTPVLVEGEGGELDILIDELEQAGISSFGAVAENRDLADEILKTIAFTEGETGAEVGEVIDTHVGGEHFYTTVLEVVLDLARQGETYAPSPGRLKTTYETPEEIGK